MKNTITILLTLVVLATIGLTACTSTETATLENTTWVLESYGEQGNLQSVLEDSEITAIFDSGKGSVSGSASCNGYLANYEVDGNQLSISGSGASTRMFCEDTMEQERRYLALLKDAETFKIQGGQLLIFCSGNQVLKFSTQ